MAADSHVSVSITDPDVFVDTLVWTQKHTYIDLATAGDVSVTVTLTDMSVTDFVVAILQGAGIKHFSFADIPSVSAEYYDEDRYEYGPAEEDDEMSYEEWLEHLGVVPPAYDEDDVIDLDDPVDEYGYLSYPI